MERIGSWKKGMVTFETHSKVKEKKTQHTLRGERTEQDVCTEEFNSFIDNILVCTDELRCGATGGGLEGEECGRAELLAVVCLDGGVVDL